MIDFTSIPEEMRKELISGVELIKTMSNRLNNLDPKIVHEFGEKLAEILCQKYTGHWFPDEPKKRQTYRCIRITSEDMDPSIVKACNQCKLDMKYLSFPQELTLWINPHEISYWMREEKLPYSLATVDTADSGPGANIILLEHDDTFTDNEYSIPTPEDDFSSESSSPPSSPSIMDEDSGYEFDCSCENCTYTPPISFSPTVEDTYMLPIIKPVIREFPGDFIKPSPLWIAPGLAPIMYQGQNMSPLQVCRSYAL